MNRFWRWVLQWGQPGELYQRLVLLQPWVAVASITMLVAGAYAAFWLAPADYQQGEVFRILYVHVPAAWLSLMIYGFMVALALLVFVWQVTVAGWALNAFAWLGAGYTLMALVTGAIWGQPTWGTWWVWDARLTSELVLLFIYLGIVLVFDVLSDAKAAARMAAILTLVGSVNLPIIHYSVIWWHTLHQPPSIRGFESSLHASMLYPLLLMALAFLLIFVWQAVWMLRCRVLQEASQTPWLARRLRSMNESGMDQ
ncbi:MAG: heme ABC transporter permease CcmC [Hydrogenovibrio sp.]|uniref:heme ABC transporter permease CcmC n=1 Tax=Hydrogenovibrio sp. TaxID=2065821 RepID=UPI00287071F7|nr:heme ABC transporter permease CcmC [Hydrogenovibrio sp.]MDR9498438.1 heme ABC transporter permease CcmC [Hydrogenovibrio sp.]